MARYRPLGNVRRNATPGIAGRTAAGTTAHAFHAFFEEHYAGFSRLAYLMTVEMAVADDLAADAPTEAWQHWDRVAAAAGTANLSTHRA